MTREKFKEYLDSMGYTYEGRGDKIFILKGQKGPSSDDVDFEGVTSIPPGVVLSNDGYVFMDELDFLPEGTEFRNSRDVYLTSVKRISERVIFENLGRVIMNNVRTIPRTIEFNNNGSVHIRSALKSHHSSPDPIWIDGIHPRELINLMVSSGLLE